MSNTAINQFLPRDANGAGRDLLRLSERVQFTSHLREVLQSLLGLCASALEVPLSETLNEYEKQLVRLADKATINQQNAYFDSVHQLRRGHKDVAPMFLRSIEDSLARMGEQGPVGKTRASAAPALKLALTDSVQLDDSLVLSDIATKVELRVREPLYSLGHRFGVLAGTARLGAEIMPLGPRALVEALRCATACLDLPLEHRLVLYRCFERVVMNPIGALYVALNNCLIERNVLPELHTLSAGPIASADAGAGAHRAPCSTVRPEHARPSSLAQRGPAGRHRVSGIPRHIGSADDSFGKLRQLLAECRRAEACTASGAELQVALAALQARDCAALADASPPLRSADELKHEILIHLHAHRVDGRTPRIGEEQGDIIDLTAMLFEFLSRRARADGLAHWILTRLQLAILRAALANQGLFSDATDAARRTLNDFVEAAQFWVDENEAEKDPALVEALQRLTGTVAAEYAGDTGVFAQARQELAQQIEMLARRVEVAERRHVDAAAGRDKLERSRLLAAAAIGTRIAARNPNEFLRTLLERGWSDVLAMTLLRDGEDSASYRRRLEVADQLLAARATQDGPAASELRHDVESGLRQIGLHDDDVDAIARKLFAGAHDAAYDAAHDNPISQTELALKLKQKARLGGELPGSAQGAVGHGACPPALTAGEQAALDLLHDLAPGTWFEFKDNPEGDTVRRKLCWYSRQTGRCLLINQRGVPAEEMTMQQLARELAEERARIATTEHVPLIDRAWITICDTLGSFSGCKPASTERMPAAEPDARTAQRAPPQAHGSRTLLVVDDEVNIQRALTRLLRTEGYRILCATSASEGMEILAQHDVQVIVSDQRMPGVSGTEFLSTVKRTHPDTVRILLSGYSDVAAVTNAINRGVVYKFLTKPWDDDDIRTQVREAFQTSELH